MNRMSLVGESWALCFSRDQSTFTARHDGHEVEEIDVEEDKARKPTNVEIRLRLAGGKELFVCLPGSETEVLIFSDLPDGDLYAVASTPYRACQVIVQDPACPRPLPKSLTSKTSPKAVNTPPHPRSVRKPPPKKKKRTFPPCPAFDSGDGSITAAMDVVGTGSWGLKQVERKVLKNENALNDRMRQQMAFMMQYGLMFRDCDSLEACFNERSVDDGILISHTLTCKVPKLSFNYIEGGFGGNSMGFMRLVRLMPSFLVVSSYA